MGILTLSSCLNALFGFFLTKKTALIAKPEVNRTCVYSPELVAIERNYFCAVRSVILCASEHMHRIRVEQHRFDHIQTKLNESEVILWYFIGHKHVK